MEDSYLHLLKDFASLQTMTPVPEYLFRDIYRCYFADYFSIFTVMVIGCYSQCLLILSTMSCVSFIFWRASTIFSAVAYSSPPTEDFHICISRRAWIEPFIIRNSLSYRLTLELAPLPWLFGSHMSKSSPMPSLWAKLNSKSAWYIHVSVSV